MISKESKKKGEKWHKLPRISRDARAVYVMVMCASSKEWIYTPRGDRLGNSNTHRANTFGKGIRLFEERWHRCVDLWRQPRDLLESHNA